MMSVLEGKADLRATRPDFGFEAGFSPIRIFVLAAKAGGWAARSTFRVALADVVKALLDCGEARFDHRLKFEVGEDIWQVLFDAFADEFTDIVGFYALRDAFPEHIDPLGTWARSWQGRERALEFPEEIVPFLNQRGRCDDVARTSTADEDAGLGFERAKRTLHFTSEPRSRSKLIPQGATLSLKILVTARPSESLIPS